MAFFILYKLPALQYLGVIVFDVYHIAKKQPIIGQKVGRLLIIVTFMDILWAFYGPLFKITE